MWMRAALGWFLSLTLCAGTAQMAAAHVDMALQAPMVICANGAEMSVTLGPDGRAVPVAAGHHQCPDCLPATLSLPMGAGGLAMPPTRAHRPLWRSGLFGLGPWSARENLPPARAPPVWT